MTEIGPRDRHLAADVVGHALFRIAPGDLPATRRRPGAVPDGWGRVAPSLLRYSDEQTVAGVASVFTAMASMGLPPAHFEDWGVVAATRYLGRASLAQALQRFDAEGVWGVSPHLIPHFALHSTSGTISLALGLHGPNLGAGGGLHSAAEGFLAALTWLAAGVVPGAWLVLSGWTPELVPGRAVGECHALALALRAPDARGERPQIRIGTGTGSPVTPELPRLADLLERPRHREVAADPTGRLRVELVPGDET